VNPEDEIKCNAEIAETKETKRDDRGIIIVKWDCQNQDGKKVLEGTLSFMAERKK
jgi:acyl dehydratase